MLFNSEEPLMKKLVAAVGGAAAAVAVSCVAYSPAAAADTADCPTMSQDFFGTQFTLQAHANAGWTGAQTNAWRSKCGYLYGLWETAESKQLQARQAEELPTAAPAPQLDPQPLQPVRGAPLIGDSVQQPSSPVDCTKLRAAYNSLGPVTSTADAVNKLNQLKIPGISQVEAASLALCSIDAIPAAIADPNQGNQQRVFDGGCGAVDEATSGIINPCGDTSAH
jgi:hypothetical protein